MPPRTISKYAIQSKIGSGGIGTVYRATDRETGEVVALKLLSSGVALDSKAARRMAREFETLSELDHENVVRVYKTGVWKGYPFLAMELIEGINLRQYLSEASDVSSDGSFSLASVSSGMIPAMSNRAWDPLDDSDFDQRGQFSEDDSDDYDDDELTGGESEDGPDALRRLADAIDEPLTEDADIPDSETMNAKSGLKQSKDGRRLSPTGNGNLFGATSPSGASIRSARAEALRLAELNSPLRIARLKSTFPQICRALAYIHMRGMIHRDIKPSNIMVDQMGVAKLMDFGLAKFLASDTEVTATGHIVGTYRYMAPEQLRGERIDGRTDLFSLGVLLYELLAGKPPFEGRSTLETCQKILEIEPVPLEQINPGVDPELARVVPWMIAKNVEDRVQTAEDLLAMLSEDGI